MNLEVLLDGGIRRGSDVVKAFIHDLARDDVIVLRRLHAHPEALTAGWRRTCRLL
jgi:hypothetical protein